MQRASYEYEEPCCQTNSKCVRLHLCPDTVVVSGIIDCEAFTDTTTKNCHTAMYGRTFGI